MPTFLVFRDLPGVTRGQYAAAQRAAADAARRASQQGREVRYRGGFFLPRHAQAICIFDAESVADVIAVNNEAGVPVREIADVIELPAEPEQGPTSQVLTLIRRHPDSEEASPRPR